MVSFCGTSELFDDSLSNGDGLLKLPGLAYQFLDVSPLPPLFYWSRLALYWLVTEMHVATVPKNHFGYQL